MYTFFVQPFLFAFIVGYWFPELTGPAWAVAMTLTFIIKIRTLHTGPVTIVQRPSVLKLLGMVLLHALASLRVLVTTLIKRRSANVQARISK